MLTLLLALAAGQNLVTLQDPASRMRATYTDAGILADGGQHIGLDVFVLNPSSSGGGSSGSSWFPDGGYLGSINAQLVDSGVAITNLGGFLGTVAVADSGISINGTVTVAFHAVQLVDSGVSILTLGGFLGTVVVADSGISINGTVPVTLGFDGGFVSVLNQVAIGFDGGLVTAQGVDPTGTARAIAVDQQGVQFVNVPAPRPNPFAPRCNPVRRTGCLP